MKTQIARLSPHQNAKVLGVLTAVTSLLFLIPMALAFSLMPQQTGVNGRLFELPLLFLIFPIMYFVMSYVMVVIGCAVYNFAFKYIGGLEFESKANEAPQVQFAGSHIPPAP